MQSQKPSSKSYYCGLCQETVPERRQRKSILGDSAKLQLSILDTLSRTIFPSLLNVHQALKSQASNYQYICNHCQGQCSKYIKLKEEFETVTSNLKGKLEQLFGTSAVPETPQHIPAHQNAQEYNQVHHQQSRYLHARACVYVHVCIHVCVCIVDIHLYACMHGTSHNKLPE